MLALNYQTPGQPMSANRARFLDNGGCGYLLKPACLLDVTTTMRLPELSETMATSTVRRLTLRVRFRPLTLRCARRATRLRMRATSADHLGEGAAALEEDRQDQERHHRSLRAGGADGRESRPAGVEERGCSYRSASAARAMRCSSALDGCASKRPTVSIRTGTKRANSPY
jgi:hypothetical protein